MRSFRSLWPTFALISGWVIGATLAAHADEIPQKQPKVGPPAAERATSDTVGSPTGIRVANQVARVAAPAGGTPREAGKVGFAADPQTGELLVPTPRFYLPDNWNWYGPTEPGTDSLGRPFVSMPYGWSGWTQEDVDALIATIEKHRALAGQGSDEADAVLGNFIGQAVVRGIDLGNLQLTSLPPKTVTNVLERMAAYEQKRYETALAEGVAYVASEYSEMVQQFVQAAGVTMADVLAVQDPTMGGAGSRTTPSGCYFRQPGNGYGLNLLVNPTVIWTGDNNIDDAQADVPIGFGFQFYGCQDDDVNTAVRVSSNGYVSFYQQGGGATNGVEYINVPIGDAAAPNGFVAGYWDDLVVINQGAYQDQISWKIEGDYGSRSLIIEYFSVSRRIGDSTDYHSFQIILHERRAGVPGASPITLAYGEPGTWWQADSLDLATVGLEGFNGVDGECIETCDLQPGEPPHNYVFYPLNNNTCDDALPLTPGLEQTTDLRFAYNTTTACGVTNADRWFRFSAPCAGTLTVTTCGTSDFGGVDQGIDTILSAHTTCPGGGGITLGCDDDGGTNCGDQGNVRDSRLSLNLGAGDTVFVRVTSFSPITSLGHVILNTTFAGSTPPANDNCGNAQAIGAPASTSGNLLCATQDGSNTYDPNTRDVWYRYQAPLAGTLRVTTCGTHDQYGIDTGMDTVVSIHSGCPGNAGNQMAWNDDSITSCGGLDYGLEFDSRVLARVSADQSVLIRVAPFVNLPNTGAFNIQTFFLTGDLDADCDVDLQDLAFLLSQFGQTGANLTGDIDGDDVVSLQDMTHLLSSFGFACPN